MDGKPILDITHAYYYQVHAQLKFRDANYCGFVVWREGELFVQRIYPDDMHVYGFGIQESLSRWLFLLNFLESGIQRSL